MQRLTAIMATLLFCFILWAIYKANIGEDTIFFAIKRAVPYGDKFAHIFLFGLLSFFLILATECKLITCGRISLPLGALITFVFVSVEEISQYFITTRTLDLMDFLASICGILIFSSLAILLNKPEHHNQP